MLLRMLRVGVIREARLGYWPMRWARQLRRVELEAMPRLLGQALVMPASASSRLFLVYSCILSCCSAR